MIGPKRGADHAGETPQEYKLKEKMILHTVVEHSFQPTHISETDIQHAIQLPRDLCLAGLYSCSGPALLKMVEFESLGDHLDDGAGFL